MIILFTEVAESLLNAAVLACTQEANVIQLAVASVFILNSDTYYRCVGDSRLLILKETQSGFIFVCRLFISVTVVFWGGK